MGAKVKCTINVSEQSYVCFFVLIVLQRYVAHSDKEYLVSDETTEIRCTPLFGWITMEDRVISETRREFEDLKPGDIMLTFSTHSLGWRHGHAGLVIDSDTVLESVMIGEKSELAEISHWSRYSSVAVLRVKDATSEEREEVAEYARKKLQDVPYHLSAGFVGEKDVDAEERWFGAHCSYLVWYAWNKFGYDLDSDGGRLVTCMDIYQSELVEVVDSYGVSLETIVE